MDASPVEARIKQALEVVAKVILKLAALLFLPTPSSTLATQPSSSNAPNVVVSRSLPNFEPFTRNLWGCNPPQLESFLGAIWEDSTLSKVKENWCNVLLKPKKVFGDYYASGSFSVGPLFFFSLCYFWCLVLLQLMHFIVVLMNWSLEGVKALKH